MSPDPALCEEYNISGVASFTNVTGQLEVVFPSVGGEGDCKLKKTATYIHILESLNFEMGL